MTQLQNSAFKMKMAPVPFVGDILPKAGAMVVSEHDGLIYYADKYGWHKADAEYSPVSAFYDYNGVDDAKFKLAAEVGSTVTLNWGDGTTDEFDGQGPDTDSEITHTYPAEGKYYFYLTGDLDGVTGIYLFVSSQICHCNLNGWGLLPSLKNLNIGTSSIPGVAEMFIGSLDYLPPLYGTMVIIACPNITGDVSRFLPSVTVNCQIINCPGVTFDNVTSANVAIVGFHLIGCGLSSSEIDKALKSAVPLTAINIMFHFNEPRTAASNEAIITLIGNGCSVGVNEPDGLIETGPELYTIEGALKIPNDSDGIAGWTLTGDPGAIFRTQWEKTAPSSDYGFMIDLNAAPTANGGIEISAALPVLVDDVMRVAFEWCHTGAGDRWALFFNGTQFFCWAYDTNTKLSKAVVYRAAGVTDLVVKFGERLSSNNGGIYLDSLSIKKAILP